MKKSGNTGDRIPDSWLPVLAVLGCLGAWEIYVRISALPPEILPGPLDVLREMWVSRGLIGMHIGQTLKVTGIGLSLAVLASVLIATAVDLSDRLRKTIYPLLVVSQTIPYFVVAPLLLIWFGFGNLSKILLVFLVCFFPVTLSMADGYRQVERDMTKVLVSMGASRLQLYRLVKIPAALPSFFTGLRIAGTYSVLGAVISEWMGGSRGLGVLMRRSWSSFETDRVFAVVLLIVLSSLLLIAAIELAARAVMPWKKFRS